MCVAFERLHRLVPADCCNLLISELAAFYEPAHGFMPKVMEPEICHAEPLFHSIPDFREDIGPSLFVLAWFAEENEIGINGAYWVLQGLFEGLGCCLGQRYGAAFPVFRVQELHHAFFRSTWCLRSEVISEERMPVSTAILTIHPSIGLW